MTDASDGPNIVTLGEGLVVRQAVDNIAWIDQGGAGVIIDALEHAHLEGEVVAAVSATLGDTPVGWVLNTHTHYDHTALNDAFRRRWGAAVINRGNADFDEHGQMRLAGDRRCLVMKPIDSGHSADDCIVWLPDDGVLFTGDVFGWGMIPLVGRLDNEAEAILLAAYEQMISHGAETVVPGHGPLCTTAELRRWTEYYPWLREEVRARVAAGEDDKDIIGAVRVPDDMTGWWRLAEWKHGRNVELVTRAIRRGAL